VPFQSVEFSPPPSFNELPTSAWTSEGFPVTTEATVSTYLKAQSGYTKNYRTEAMSVWSLIDLEMATTLSGIYIKAKCQPTMHKIPPFYSLFAVLKDGAPP